MKKFFLIVTLLIGVLLTTVAAEEVVSVDESTGTEQVMPDVVSTTPALQEAELLVDKYSDKLYMFLEDLGEKLEQPAGYVFEKAVQAKYYEGIIPLIVLVFSFIFLVIGVVMISYQLPEDGPFGFVGIVNIIVFGFIFIAAVIESIICLPYLFTPEWYAIQDLLELLNL